MKSVTMSDGHPQQQQHQATSATTAAAAVESSKSAASPTAASGSSGSKAWAPLRKRLAVIRTVKLFSRDRDEKVTSALLTGRPPTQQQQQQQQQQQNLRELFDDDGGVYCGGDSSEGEKSASKATSQPSVDMSVTASPSGGSSRRVVGGGASGGPRRPEVHAEEDEDDVDEDNTAAEEAGGGGGGGGSSGAEGSESGNSDEEDDDDDEDEDDDLSSAAASQGAAGGGAGGGKPNRLDKVRLFGKPAIHRSQSTGDSHGAGGGGGGGGGGAGGSSGSSSGGAAAADGATPAHALFLQHKQRARPRKSPDESGESRDSGGGVYDGDENRASSGDSRKKKKSIGEKLNFLSRKTPGDNSPTASSKGRGDTSGASASEKSVRAVKPSHDQVQRWGASFDSLLNDKYGLALFRAFLKTEYSDENIEFWVACEEYRSLTGPKKQALKAQKIYNEFVAFQAPREVNLDSTTRLATINAMGSPDRHLFEQAQKRIQALMEKDSYQRFLRSDVYQAHLRETQQRDTASAPAASAAASVTS